MKKLISLFVISLPIVTYAYSDLGQLVGALNGALSATVPLLLSLATLVFLWGIVKYIWSGDDEKQRTESRSFMLWGIVGLTVMVSVWALVSLLANFFSIPIPFAPSLPSPQR